MALSNIRLLPVSRVFEETIIIVLHCIKMSKQKIEEDVSKAIKYQEFIFLILLIYKIPFIEVFFIYHKSIFVLCVIF